MGLHRKVSNQHYLRAIPWPDDLRAAYSSLYPTTDGAPPASSAIESSMSDQVSTMESVLQMMPLPKYPLQIRRKRKSIQSCVSVKNNLKKSYPNKIRTSRLKILQK